MPMSPEEYRWFDERFQGLRDAIDGKESKIHKLDLRVNDLENAAPHKCAEAVAKHVKGSFIHNPLKAVPLIGSLIGVYEGVKKLWNG